MTLLEPSPIIKCFGELGNVLKHLVSVNDNTKNWITLTLQNVN